MKKKIGLIILIIISFLAITGCKKITTAGKESFKELEYDLPEGYAKTQDYEAGEGNLTRNYWYNEDEHKGIQLFYYQNKDYSFLFDEYDKYEEIEINGTTWRKVNDTLAGLNYDSYSAIYGNDLYVIELDSIDKYPELSKFMDGVKFN